VVFHPPHSTLGVNGRGLGDAISTPSSAMKGLSLIVECLAGQMGIGEDAELGCWGLGEDDELGVE
jgi:hypothetical protein